MLFYLLLSCGTTCNPERQLYISQTVHRHITAGPSHSRSSSPSLSHYLYAAVVVWAGVCMCVCLGVDMEVGRGLQQGNLKGGDKGTEERTKETNFSPITHLLWATAQKNGPRCRLGSPNWHGAKKRGEWGPERSELQIFRAPPRMPAGGKWEAALQLVVTSMVESWCTISENLAPLVLH